MNLTPEEFKDAFCGHTLLKHARFRGEETIWNWKFIDPEIDSLTRIYYKPSEEGGGFKFYALVISGSLVSDLIFDEDNTVVECLFEGYGYYDGIRHLYMGSKQHDNYGYLYYPDLKDYTRLFEIILDLESKYCDK